MPQDETSPAPRSLRPPHEQRLLQMSEVEYQQWRHQLQTADYLKYLEDLYQVFRTSVADLLEAGTLDRQAEVIRGRLLTLRELQDLKLSDIQRFYRQEGDEGTDGTKVD